LYITLTDYGFEHKEEVLESVYSFLLFLEEKGPNEDFFKDIAQIKSNEFRFESNSRDNAAELACNMKIYKPKDIITGPKLMFEYDEELINKTIMRLNEGKMNLMIFAPKIETDSTESWMNIKYKLEGRIFL
jgi:secreted Zn-dependent insulinase-like peptidase